MRSCNDLVRELSAFARLTGTKWGRSRVLPQTVVEIARLAVASVITAVCFYNLATNFDETMQLTTKGGSYVGHFDDKFSGIRSELVAAGSTRSVGYLLDVPFPELPSRVQDYFLEARYGLAPIMVRAATAEDDFVIFDGRARLRPGVPSNLRLYKDFGDGVFLLKAVQ
jgi:hypothetical protein